jgi:CSLREA domain-containing protein
MGTLFTHRIVRISLLTLALVGLLWLLLSAPAQAVRSPFPPPSHIVVTVTTPIDEYDVAANGTCSLREAISTVNGSLNVGGCTRGAVSPSGPPTIILPSDTYTLTITGANEDQNATGDLDIRQSVIISTTGALPATVAGMANWDDRIFHILTGTVTIRGSAIRGGHPLGGGGGLLIESGASLTLDDSVVADNSSFNVGGPLRSEGGGIRSSGILTLTNVTLSGNSAGRDLENGFGGGIYNSGTTTLNNSTLSGNSATTNGGGIYNDGTAMLNNSTLSGNSANQQGGGFGGGGGGMYNYGGTATLNNSTLNGNSANNDGGGIYNSAGTATLNNSTLSGNSAGNGGGIYNNSDASLFNVTVSNNSATSGGALFMVSGHTTVLSNTILAYSGASGNCIGTITASKFTFSSDYSCALPPLNTIHGMNPNNLDPLLTALGNYGGPTLVHMLKLGSPAIDGVVGTDAPSTDQRGVGRPQPLGGQFDIGSVERQPTDSSLAPRLYLPLIKR